MKELEECRPGYRQRLGIEPGRGRGWQESLDAATDEIYVGGDNAWELAAAALQLRHSRRPVKILTVEGRNVRKAAHLFRYLGIQGVVRDPMGLMVVPVGSAPLA